MSQYFSPFLRFNAVLLRPASPERRIWSMVCRSFIFGFTRFWENYPTLNLASRSNVGALSARYMFLGVVVGTIIGFSPINVKASPTVGVTTLLGCGGTLEADVWRQWDMSGASFVRDQLIQTRLIGSGDTYALYDFQILFHNLLAMAQRCHRLDRQQQLAALVKAAYTQLVPAPEGQFGRAWICRGGSICNHTNRLIYKEVELTSVQFLAFAASLSNGLIVGDSNAPAELGFTEQTASIVSEHLIRWSNLNERAALRKRISAKVEDVKTGSSSLFFLDRDLWRLVIYAEMAGIYVKRPDLLHSLKLQPDVFAAMREHIVLLLKLFSVRTTFKSVLDPIKNEMVSIADLDAGFWRLYSDNRYAGYTDAKKPVVCRSVVDMPDAKALEIQIEANDVAPVPDLGWDIGHARRLVQFFESIERNRAALSKVFDISSEILPNQATFAAYARQLRIKAWNQDKARPLFSNYLNGANGWYRVAYNNGTGSCREGTPPFGLTDSFPTGGYAGWAKVDLGLRGLGEQLLTLSRSSAADDREFIDAYYPRLGSRVSGNQATLNKLMFWPTLINP